MNLIERLSITNYTFSNLPIEAKKAIIQFRMREEESLGEDLIEIAIERKIITNLDASRICEQLSEALKELDDNPVLWGEALRIVENIFSMFDHGEYAFSYLNIAVSELIEHVSSFDEYCDFEQFHQSYIKDLPADRHHPEHDMWSVFLQDFDDEDPIYDGNHRFHCAVRDGREKISVILF